MISAELLEIATKNNWQIAKNQENTRYIFIKRTETTFTVLNATKTDSSWSYFLITYNLNGKNVGTGNKAISLNVLSFLLHSCATGS